MDTRKIFRLAIFSSLILGCLTPIQMRALSRQRRSRLATRMALLPRESIKIFSAMIWWSNRQNW